MNKNYINIKKIVFFTFNSDKYKHFTYQQKLYNSDKYKNVTYQQKL